MSDSKSLQELSDTKYWDERYESAKEKKTEGQENENKELGSFEWFKNFDQLREFLGKVMPEPESGCSVLHLGCGNSTLPADLHALAYHNQLAIDFSQIAISAMATKYNDLEGLEWEVMDVRDLQIKTGSFDVAIDKGTLDAMLHGSLWDPPEEVKKNVGKYVDEVARVLKSGGKWIYITYRQPHFMKPLLIRDGIWELELSVLGETGAGEFEYFGFVMTKFGDGEGEIG